MEGEKKKAGSRSCIRKKANLKPGSIQEYDFFVIRNGREAEEAAHADHLTKARKKAGRKKDGSFLLSD